MLLRLGTIFLLCHVLATATFTQEPEEIDCANAPEIERPTTGPVSVCVITAKPRNLAKPQYPEGARAMGVRGPVVVSLLIDSRGCVAEARAISGHPFLRAASEAAARRSAFSPILLSGNPVWVTGIITYNYVTDRPNWLELGYFSDSPERLIEYLPLKFEDVRSEFDSLTYLNRRVSSDAIAELISARLAGRPKERWLFEVGMHLIAIKHRGSEVDHFAELDELILNTPEGISPELVEFSTG